MGSYSKTGGSRAGKRNIGKVLTRFITSKAKRKLKKSGQALSYLTRINELKDEIEILTAYSSDTVYRLRYDTMKYDYISPSVAKLVGYTPAEIKKISFRSLIVDTKIVTNGMKSVESYVGLEQVRKSGETRNWQADYLIKTKQGSEIWVSDISYPWFDKKGNVIGSIGVLRDITERVKAEKQIQEELIKLANTDMLTGLANRRHFFDRLDEEQKRARRNNSEFSIMLIDIDYFKRVNDTYGHDAGDKIIVEIGKQIQSCLRETDLAARLGGEEYGVIMPETPLEGAYYVADRIRSIVARGRVRVSDAAEIGCTISIGIAECPNHDPIDVLKLYKMADTRLYIAKNTGRNQVSIDELVALH